MNGPEAFGKIIPTSLGSIIGGLAGMSYWSGNYRNCGNVVGNLCVDTPIGPVYGQAAFVVACTAVGFVVGALVTWIMTRLNA